MNIEIELWNIFTCYTLHGSPRDPGRIAETQFLKLLRDTMVMDGTMTDEVLTQSMLHLIWTTELKTRASQKKSKSELDKLEYKEFLSCLIRVATRCYPSCESAEESMHQLLMDNILPMAARRRPFSMSSFVSQPGIMSLFEYYSDALTEIFKYYGKNAESLSKSMFKTCAATSKSFDEEKQLIAESHLLTKTKREETKKIFSKKNETRLAYSEFLKFASDFGLSSSMGLSTLDLGDIYLSVICETNFETIVRSVSFSEFWEVLVRCAFVAFKESKGISSSDKIKGMFLYIWRHMQHKIVDGGNNKNDVNTQVKSSTAFEGALLRGSKILNERFILAWKSDEFRDYLEKPKATIDDEILERDCLLTSTIGVVSPTKASAREVLQREEAQSRLKKTQELKSVTAASLVTVRIKDSDNLGDDRIKPTQLRKLLQHKPDLAQLLFDCVVDEGLNNVDDGDDLENNDDVNEGLTTGEGPMTMTEL
mmetsp:Transcript_28979/g.53860  ORF Transcript_28979/g.53860 Transcript_28979/m.53860 type:complete len:480 (+) Transcript_28979:163-1602(+)